MRPVILLLQKTFVQTFYLRNAIFFGVVLFFFVLVVRPPTFFFSRDFVAILLGDWRATGLVLLVALLYWGYALRFLRGYPQEPGLHFLHVLPALGRRQLSLVVSWAVLGILAPMLGYLAVMAFHAVSLGAWTGIPVAVALAGLWWGGVRLTVARLMGPLAVSGKPLLLHRPFRIATSSMPFIYFGMLWRRHRSALVITKAVSLLLIGLLLGAEVLGEVAYALEGLAFLLSGLLQGFLADRLRQTEELELSWFRNLPYSWWRRWLQWGGTALLLNLPEIIAILLFTLRDGLSPWLLPHFVLTVAAYWWLCLGLGYLPQMRKQDFQVLVYSCFMAVFIALLFKVSFLLIFTPLLMLGGLMYARRRE